MGHDISGYNKVGKEIAYARFNMWNGNATILYRLLDALDFHAGVSGCGRSSTFSIEQMEKALNDYSQEFKQDVSSPSERDLFGWDLKQILEFIQDCLETAQIEGSVRVYFG